MIRFLDGAVIAAEQKVVVARAALSYLEEKRSQLNEAITEARVQYTLAERELALARERLAKAKEPPRVPALMRKGDRR